MHRKIIQSFPFIIVYLVILGAGLFINFHTDTTVPINRDLSEFPAKHGQWQILSQIPLGPDILNALKPTDYLLREYVNIVNGSRVQLYIGFHNGSMESGGIHSPRNCLPGNGWYEVTLEKFPIELRGRMEHVVRGVYQKGGDKTLFLYWFQMKGKILNNEYSLKLEEITNSLIYGRRDEAFIRISVPSSSDQSHDEDVASCFAREFNPLIDSFLPM